MSLLKKIPDQVQPPWLAEMSLTVASYYLNDQRNECGDVWVDELAMCLKEEDDDDGALCQDFETEQTLGEYL